MYYCTSDAKMKIFDGYMYQWFTEIRQNCMFNNEQVPSIYGQCLSLPD